jgi:hypothetical protein
MRKREGRRNLREREGGERESRCGRRCKVKFEGGRKSEGKFEERGGRFEAQQKEWGE